MTNPISAKLTESLKYSDFHGTKQFIDRLQEDRAKAAAHRALEETYHHHHPDFQTGATAIMDRKG